MRFAAHANRAMRAVIAGRVSRIAAPRWMPGLDLDEFRGNRLSFPPAAAASEARRMSDYTIHGELMEGIEGHGITKVEPMKKVAPAKGVLNPLYVDHDRDITELSAMDATKFYTFSGTAERAFLPEGCAAVQHEMESTDTRQLLVRNAFLRALAHVAPGGAQGQTTPELSHANQLYLEGPAGSGKSVMLAQMVHWARARGCLVLYIPDARYYLSNSNYTMHEESRMLETPNTACVLLKALHHAHASLLSTITLKDGTNLGKLVEEGVQYEDAAGGTDAPPVMDIAMKVLDALHDEDLGVPVVFAVDNFNSWLAGSEFLEPTSDHFLRQHAAKEIMLVNRLLDMRRPISNGTRIFAASKNAGVSPKVSMVAVPFNARRRLQPFSHIEISQYIAHMRRQGRANERATVKEVQFLSGGNGVMVRKVIAILTQHIPVEDIKSIGYDFGR